MPLVFSLREDSFGRSLVFTKIDPKNIPQALSHIEDTWKKHAPGYPFTYEFLDESFEHQYRTDLQRGEIFKYFSLLAILISCLGIIGLAVFMTERRTKEIGVRKILGSSVFGIIRLISKEFLLLMMLSNAVAWPIGFFLSHNLLKSYAYRTGLSFGIFLLAGILSCFIALAAVCFQAVKAAAADPINSLRYE
jgi:putative ABC transport system permease protein